MRFRRLYSDGAVITFNTILAVVLLSVVAWGLFRAKDAATIARERRAIASDTYYGADIKHVYPGMNDSEIHDLLEETWTRPLTFEPLTGFKEAPFAGRYVNVDAAGYRHIRDQAPWPPGATGTSIVVFGGSTTFGFGVPDWETVPSSLQEALRSAQTQVDVYNFGRGFYYSTQERVFFEQLLARGHVPAIAIFIDGVNEFAIPDNVPEFSDRLAGMMEDANRPDHAASALGVLMRELPLYRAAQALAGRRQQAGNPQAADAPRAGDNERRTEPVIANYLANKRMIEGLSREFGVKPVFVWQPASSYAYDTRFHLFRDQLSARNALSGPGYRKMYDLFSTPLGRTEAADAIWAADLTRDSHEALYVDANHYTAALSRRLAEYVAGELVARHVLIPN